MLDRVRRACCVVAIVAIACAFPIGDDEPSWPRLPLATPRAIQLAVGPQHACARMADLTLRCWGEPERQPGTRTDAIRYTPVELPATGVLDVAVDSSQTCAQLSTGERRCWGEPGPGPEKKCRIDDRANVLCDTIDRSHHVIAVRDAIEVAIGSAFTCALRRDRTVWCWGDNLRNELGDGTTTSRVMPQRVPGIDDAVELVGTRATACVRRASGAVACWGSDGSVQRSRPTPIAGIDHAVQIGMGDYYTCVRSDDGQISCWGRGPGVLGDGKSVPRETPMPVVWEPRASRAHVPDARAVSVAIIGGSTCALREDGTVWCWGALDAGGRWSEPRQILGITDAVKLEANIGFTATDRDGVVYAWAPGQRPVMVQRALTAVRNAGFDCVLGLDHTATCTSEDRDRMSVRHVTQLVVSHGPICAVLDNRSVSCLSSAGWTPIPELAGATQLAVEDRDGCARMFTGEVSCWVSFFRSMASIDLRNVVDVFVGGHRACARTEAGRIWCWKENQPSIEVPELFGARTIAMGDDHECAVLAGDVVCKGSNQTGELGDGTNIDRNAWVHVAW